MLAFLFIDRPGHTGELSRTEVDHLFILGHCQKQKQGSFNLFVASFGGSWALPFRFGSLELLTELQLLVLLHAVEALPFLPLHVADDAGVKSLLVWDNRRPSE